MNTEIIKTDFLIAGSGLAGITAALRASAFGTVTLVTKSGFSVSSSYWAQGGIAAVLNPSDSYSNHVEDTLLAGRGYGNPEAVNILVEEGAERVKELINTGVPFDKKGGTLLLGLEGGHSARRVIHAGGASTGKIVVEHLIKEIENNPRIKVLEHTFIYDLLQNGSRCYGAMAINYRENKSLQLIGKSVLLATGGYSSLFQQTTNPHTSTGDGLWLAYKAGAVLKDLEFIQFHPTACQSKKSVFLISEALRGEGAYLRNSDGERFMMSYPDAELSPRDVVASEIVKQIKQQSKSHVFLDLTHLNTNNLRKRYPELINRIEECGLDISKEWVPVAPAAHYCIGGVETGLNGETCVEGLYAIGEIACTGVHGANRLASNSLLECLVFGHRAAEHATRFLPDAFCEAPEQHELTFSNDLVKPFAIQKEAVTKLLNQYAGIERDSEGLKLAIHRINHELQSPLYRQGREYFFIKMREMLRIADMILQAALRRKESIGVHKRTDYPQVEKAPMPAWRFHNSDGEANRLSNTEVS